MRGTDFLASGDFLKESFIKAIGGLFEQSLILAFPVLGTLILISVTMGLLAKAAPQMNLMMVGFPVQIAVGFIILLVASPLIIEKMAILVDAGFRYIESYLISVKGALQ
jgi:flagellar biosynthetic protein FliR